MRARLVVTTAVLSASFAAPAAARIGFQNNIPNGATFSCLACHNSASGGARDEWNAFGDTMFVENGGVADDPDSVDAADADFSFWSAAICEADSDGDGATNGVELGDPDCVWAPGDDPAVVDGITDPSNPESVPVTTPEPAGCASQATTSTDAPAALALVGLLGVVLGRRRRARR